MRFVDTSKIRTRLDERVSVADGTELSVDLYLPPEAGRYPVLLTRTPADNNRAGRLGISRAPAERWKSLAAQGYIVAAGDVRGRGDSGGDFVPFAHEATDGADTVAWLRTHEECNKKVGLFGCGYGAFCAWAAAVADGNVDAVASVSPFGAVGNGLPHRGGAVRLDWLFWMHLIGGRTLQPASVPPWPAIHRHLPLSALHEALGRHDIWWQEWLSHLDPSDPLWSPLSLADKITELNIPGLHITGWWDGYAAGADYYYQAARHTRAPQRLIIGPWDTAAVRHPAPFVGGFDFGPRSLIDLDEVLIAFFDASLSERTGLRNQEYMEFTGTSNARVFVTGRNEWVTCAAWPGDSENTLTLHLSSTTGANTRCGDGTLCSEPPSHRGMDAVTHNPDVPVEFQPQFIGFAAGTNHVGFTLEQSHITGRDEALVYTSTPLERSITVFGRAKVILTVRALASDADIYVLLSDTFPLGIQDLHLSHAAVRLATLASFRCGEAVTLSLELDAIAHEFLPGHQIRLTVLPSLFPLYARNLQGREYTHGREVTVADIEIYHGPDQQGLLTFPLSDEVMQKN